MCCSCVVSRFFAVLIVLIHHLLGCLLGGLLAILLKQNCKQTLNMNMNMEIKNTEYMKSNLEGVVGGGQPGFEK